MKNKNYQKRGFLKMILVIVGALVLLKYAYDIDVIGFLTTGQAKVYLDKIYGFWSSGWEKYYGVAQKVWSYTIDWIKTFID